MPDKLTDSRLEKIIEEVINLEPIDFCKVMCKFTEDIINRLQADCENYKQIAEYQQSVTMDRGFEIKRLKEKIENLKAENEKIKITFVYFS